MEKYNWAAEAAEIYARAAGDKEVQKIIREYGIRIGEIRPTWTERLLGFAAFGAAAILAAIPVAAFIIAGYFIAIAIYGVSIF
jgi:hypothetical protein